MLNVQNKGGKKTNFKISLFFSHSYMYINPNWSQCHLILNFHRFSLNFRTGRQVQDCLPWQMPSLCPLRIHSLPSPSCFRPVWGDSHGPHQQSPLPSVFLLGSTKGKPWQEMDGRKENESSELIPPAAPLKFAPDTSHSFFKVPSSARLHSGSRGSPSSHLFGPRVITAHLILPNTHNLINKHSWNILISVCSLLSVWSLNDTI